MVNENKPKKHGKVPLHFNKTPHALDDYSFQCIGQKHAITDEDVEKLLIIKEAYWSAQCFFFSLMALIGGKNSIPRSASIIRNSSSPGCKFLAFFS